MAPVNIALQTAEAIEKQFDLHDIEALRNLDEQSLLELLRTHLAERIRDMMNRNFEMLMQTLYQIDVDEQSVKEVFRGTDEVVISTRLASLVIERQRQKAMTRAAYRHRPE